MDFAALSNALPEGQHLLEQFKNLGVCHEHLTVVKNPLTKSHADEIKTAEDAGTSLVVQLAIANGHYPGLDKWLS